jgi:hypothetical protein
MNSLELRAQACEQIADTALLHADSTQIQKEYTESLGGDREHNLYTTAHIGWSPIDPESISTNSMLYIKKQKMDYGSVLFSLNISELIHNQKVSGLTTGMDTRFLSRICNGTTTNGHYLMQLALDAARRTLHPSEIAEINRLYMVTSELGHLTSFSYRTITLIEEEVHIQRHIDSTGVYKPSPYGMPLKIKIGNKDQELHTVLQKLPNGEYETFEELGNEKRLNADTVEKEDILSIEVEPGIFMHGIKGRFEKIAVLDEAERATGLRNLTDERLSKIEIAMAKVKDIITLDE